MDTAIAARTTAPIAASSASSELMDLIGLNEEIKRVVEVAFKINIMALNAIFLAKRAGTTALGFAVLSNELRVFSLDLRNSMRELTEMVHGCVFELTRVVQERRYTRLLRQTSGMADSPRLLTVLERHAKATEEDAARLSALRRRLRRTLEDARQLVELGGVLAKSAKIEAAYGREFSTALTQVSGDFDYIVEEIRVTLDKLLRSAFLAAKTKEIR